MEDDDSKEEFVKSLSQSWPWPTLAPLATCGTSATRFVVISPLWQTFTSLWQIFDCIFIIKQNIDSTLANLWHYWANFYCCKWSNFEKQFNNLVILHAALPYTHTLTLQIYFWRALLFLCLLCDVTSVPTYCDAGQLFAKIFQNILPLFHQILKAGLSLSLFVYLSRNTTGTFETYWPYSAVLW